MTRASYDVVLLPGDGIGAEVSVSAKAILELVAQKTDTAFNLQEVPCGGKYYLEHGRDWPEGSEERCKQADLILLGAVGWPSPTGSGPVTMDNGQMAGWSAVIGNRTKLDLYANVRPVKLFEGVQHRVSGTYKQVWESKHVDMVFLRENTEGLYAGMGGVLKPGGQGVVATDTRVITRASSERIIRMAFETAMRRSGAPKDGKKRVTAVVKNNVLHGCRFFADIFKEVGEEYPDVEKNVAIIDAFTQWLITQPEFYDVVVTTNMFGDIVTDLASVLQGGMGMAVGCNVGDDHAMFEPIHGSAPEFAGKDCLNPMAMMLSTGEGLIWLGQKKGDDALQKAGEKVEEAVRAVLKKGETLTQDLVEASKASSMSTVSKAVLEVLEPLL